MARQCDRCGGEGETLVLQRIVAETEDGAGRADVRLAPDGIAPLDLCPECFKLVREAVRAALLPLAARERLLYGPARAGAGERMADPQAEEVVQAATRGPRSAEPLVHYYEATDLYASYASVPGKIRAVCGAVVERQQLSRQPERATCAGCKMILARAGNH